MHVYQEDKADPDSMRLVEKCLSTETKITYVKNICIKNMRVHDYNLLASKKCQYRLLWDFPLQTFISCIFTSAVGRTPACGVRLLSSCPLLLSLCLKYCIISRLYIPLECSGKLVNITTAWLSIVIVSFSAGHVVFVSEAVLAWQTVL